jgi:putative chitinase
MITPAQWLKVLSYCGVRFTTAEQWSKVFETYVQPEAFNLGVRELDDFTGQVLHETAQLEHLEENLNYSARRMTEVWPQRFPTIDSALPYQYLPQALANKVYGGRLGNVELGDGWKYRGGGIPMVTGKANYALLQQLTGLPLIEHPELIRQPDGAMRCGVLWWEKKIPDSAIDSVERVTRAVQGAQLGLIDRAQLTARAGHALASIA